MSVYLSSRKSFRHHDDDRSLRILENGVFYYSFPTGLVGRGRRVLTGIHFHPPRSELADMTMLIWCSYSCLLLDYEAGEGYWTISDTGEQLLRLIWVSQSEYDSW